MYFVAVSLTGKPEQYQTLENAIKLLGPWSNRLPATWIVECRLSAKRIRDLLKPHLQPADRLFVGQFNKNWAGTNMGNGFPDWMGRRSFDGPTVATQPSQPQGENR